MHKNITINDLEALKSGDKSAFSLIYSGYNKKVYALAFRFLKNQAQSEEIVQETFLNLWVNKEKIDQYGNVWLYLYVIAKRLCIDELRKIHNSAGMIEKLLLNISAINNTTEEVIIAKDMERMVDALLEKLPGQQQLVYKLSRNEGLTHKEIADRLKISTNTVKNHMVEALKTLRGQMRYSNMLYILLFFL